MLVHLLVFISLSEIQTRMTKADWKWGKTDNNLNFSNGTHPKSMLHTGQHSISSSNSFLFMHFLQTIDRKRKTDILDKIFKIMQSG